MIYLKAVDFGLPQRRQRLFILAVHRERAASELMYDADTVLDMALKTYLPLLRIDCPNVEPHPIVYWFLHGRFGIDI